MTLTRLFHIGDVLTVTTGRLVSDRHMDGAYDILSFMTGDDDIYTHQIPRAFKTCRPALVAQYPHLSEEALAEDLEALIKEPVTDVRLAGWLKGMASRFGAQLQVQTLQPGGHDARDPLEELEQMVGKDRVVPIVVKP